MNSRLKKRKKVAIYENILKNIKNGIGTAIIIWIGYKQKVREMRTFSLPLFVRFTQVIKEFFHTV